MIVTVTLNPAIDIKYTINKFQLHKVNRIDSLEKTPGGKGINVSKVLKKLDADILATGFLGGVNGNFIENALMNLKIKSEFTHIKGETRNCFAIHDLISNTEILEKGPLIEKNKWLEFKEKFRKLISQKDMVILSGSLPQGLEKCSYGELIDIAKEKNINCFLDTSGANLKESLKYKPYFIKPNIHELEELFKCKISDEEEIIEKAMLLYKDGIENVMVSLGGEGALLLNSSGVFRGILPKVEIKNTVGSGDSTVAGFAYGISQNLSIENIMKLALSCGTSNAMLESTGDIDLEMINKLENEIKINKIER